MSRTAKIAVHTAYNPEEPSRGFAVKKSGGVV